MSQDQCKVLLTPTGELILKEKKLKCLSKALLDGINEKILHLDLRNNEIQHLENSVLTNLTHLRSLDIRCNKLEVLTDQISALIHLKVLKLDHNLLTSLPLELFKLPLTQLSIGDNSLFSIPSQISELKSLTVFVLSENQIKIIPKELGELEDLKILYLHSNEFSSLPSTLYKLSNLEEFSLEWFRYTSPALTKIIKGHIGETLLYGLRDFFLQYYRNNILEISLESFLIHFSDRDFGLNKVDIRQRSLFHLAVTNGDIGVVKGLIESGCDMNIIDIDGFSPLVIALKEDNVAVAKIMIQAGARLDIGAGCYGSVLNLAVIKSEPWLVTTLIKAGADVNMQDSEGNSCLHHLMTIYKKHKHRNALIADMIVDAGAKLNLFNNEKWAAVHIAARKGQTSAFRWITDKNPELKLKNLETFNVNLLGGSRGWSPIHVASHSGHYKTVETLVAAGAEVYIKNYDGKTPKDTSKGDLAIYKFLSRIEQENIRLIIHNNPQQEHDDNLQQVSEANELSYKKLYEYYKNNDASAIENLLQTDNSIGLKTDAVYLLSQLKQRKAAKILLFTINSEDSLIKYESAFALEGIKDLENREKHPHTLIGPKLPRTSPLQMSLPANISAFIEEETRIDTLLIL